MAKNRCSLQNTIMYDNLIVVQGGLAMVIEDLKGQSLRDHLVEFHAQDSAEVAKKNERSLDMFHFIQHDRMNLGWSVTTGTRAHTHRGMR